ncbi:MAG TPA: NifU family protein [Burkholderiales bacterium]|nr:NifU family protein [Burkholderiales bacterium]
MSAPAKLDAPFYTEEELDALEKKSPVEALRIAREQAQLARRLAAEPAAGAALPTLEEARAVLEEARRILLRDGGDLELVGLEGGVLVVRLKGACAGCPRSALDLKQVVEALVRRRYPALREVRNVY